MSNVAITRTSLLSLLALTIDEPNPVLRVRAVLACERMRHDYVAQLLVDALWRNPAGDFNDLLNRVCEMESNITEHQVFMAFAERFSGRIARATASNQYELLVLKDQLHTINFFEPPSTGGIRMMALYSLAHAGAHVAPAAFLQSLYDQEHDDLAVRIAVWELLNSGEIVEDPVDGYHLPATT